MEKINRSTLIKAAKLYYTGNLSQEQAAKIMGVSRPKMSRMLSMARELKIVEFKIADATLINEDMAQKLQEQLGLRQVIVVPSGAAQEQSRQNAGKAAGDYLNTILRDGMTIGISWGTTMDSMVNQFNPQRPIGGAVVVQLVGGVRTPSFNIDSRELALSLAQKLDANYSILQAPLLVSNSGVRDVILSEPEFAAHFRLFHKLDAAFVGIGSDVPEHSVPYKAGYISLAESTALVNAGFATDVCGSRIYKDGSIQTNLLSGRVIAIPLERIRATPLVIGVAVGEDKARSILTAAKGGFIKTLITDEVGAISIMGLLCAQE